MNQFSEGQQVWLCVSMFGLLQRVKGIVVGVEGDRYRVLRFDHRQTIDIPRLEGKRGTNENPVWLEVRF